MFPSYEVRWFFSQCPEALSGWMETLGHSLDDNNTAERTDFYLPLVGLQRPGIKLREGRIEVKQLINEPGMQLFPYPAAKGNVQHWIKWSFGLCEDDGLALGIIREGKHDWVSVRKKRCGFTYHFAPGGEVAKTSMGALVEEGCQVELTRIKVFGETHYTFGLEAFSQSGSMADNFQRGTELAFSEFREWNEGKSLPQVEFDGRNSKSYPEFLMPG